MMFPDNESPLIPPPIPSIWDCEMWPHCILNGKKVSAAWEWVRVNREQPLVNFLHDHSSEQFVDEFLESNIYREIVYSLLLENIPLHPESVTTRLRLGEHLNAVSEMGAIITPDGWASLVRGQLWSAERYEQIFDDWIGFYNDVLQAISVREIDKFKGARTTPHSWVFDGADISSCSAGAMPPDRIRPTMTYLMEATGLHAEMLPIVQSALTLAWVQITQPIPFLGGYLSRAMAYRPLRFGTSLEDPLFISISESLYSRRHEYSSKLKSLATSGNTDITSWSLWVVTMYGDACSRALSRMRYLERQTRIRAWIESLDIAPRCRSFLSTNFLGRHRANLTITRRNYARSTRCSLATASRDLQNLVRIGILQWSGDHGRSTEYFIPWMSPGPHRSILELLDGVVSPDKPLYPA